MLTLFELWSFKTQKYHFKWFIESNSDTEDFTSILTVKDRQNVEIYRDYKYNCGFTPAKVDTHSTHKLPFYTMVRDAIRHLRSKDYGKV